MITTHFLDICKKLDHSPDFKNNFMDVKEVDSNFTYTYKLKPGISTIKGGIKVLQDLKYPTRAAKYSEKFSSIYVIIHYRFMILNNKLLIAIFILIIVFIIYSSYS